jgi:copper resistance protein C
MVAERDGSVVGVILAFVLVCGWSALSWAHAFPEHCDPSPGAKLAAAPGTITIHFDSAIEPTFSAMRVEDASGRPVDNNDSHNDPVDPQRLSLTVPPLSTGIYRVRWSVVARDGHQTEGDYTFTIR